MTDRVEPVSLTELNEAYPNTLAAPDGHQDHRGLGRCASSARCRSRATPSRTGVLHGGASCVLAETLGSTGAALHAGREKFTVGIEINATHHRAATVGPADRRGDQVARGPHAGHVRHRDHRRGRPPGLHGQAELPVQGRRPRHGRAGSVARGQVRLADVHRSASLRGLTGGSAANAQVRHGRPQLGLASANGCSTHTGRVMAVSAHEPAAVATVFPGARDTE